MEQKDELESHSSEYSSCYSSDLLNIPKNDSKQANKQERKEERKKLTRLSEEPKMEYKQMNPMYFQEII